MSIRAWLSGALAFGLGAAIWALSPVVTGMKEPWDSSSGTTFYGFSLLLTGFCSGLLAGKSNRLWIAPLGAIIGQFLYILLFLPIGPLIAIGVLFLCFYSLLVVVGSILAIGCRNLAT